MNFEEITNSTFEQIRKTRLFLHTIKCNFPTRILHIYYQECRFSSNFIARLLNLRANEKYFYPFLTEMHRTQSEFDDNLTFKVFLFQFINFYSSIFYIAFFKGRFVGYPGHYKHIFGNLRNEDVSYFSIYNFLNKLLLKQAIQFQNLE